MKYHPCSGTMSGGTRHCYFRGVVEYQGAMWCNKCIRLKRAPPRKDHFPKRMSDQELLELSRKHKLQELYNNKMKLYMYFCKLLKEVLESRGLLK
jgi:hypothetical protein